MRTRVAFPAAAALVGALLVPTTSAQSLWTIDGAGQMTGQTGPPSGTCGYPLGSLTAQWSYVTPGFCSTPDVTGGVNGTGGLGMDRALNELWVTDGSIAASYANYGTPLTTGVDVAGLLGGAITGIDWDGNTGLLWVTDGASAASAQISYNGNCWDAILQTSFALPTTLHVTALSCDPVTDTLWVTDIGGTLTQVTKTGAIGPLGSADVTVTSGCTLAPSLTGVAADSAGPAGRVYVTDGVNVAVVDMSLGGSAAAPTFYSPSSCFPIVAPLADGLAIAATGNLFGSASAGSLPAIGSSGQSVIPNPNFKIEVGGLQENDIAILALSTDHLCPSTTVLGVPFHLSPTPLITVATLVAPDTGFLSVGLPLGVGTPIGETIFLQWGAVNPLTFAASSTRGLAMTTSLP